MSQGMDDRAVASPCVSVCVMDPVSGLCAGCYRTLAEIADWINFSSADKRAVIAQLAVRRERHGVLPGLLIGADAQR